MKNYKWIVILLNLLLLLVYFHYSIVKKEEILKDGQLVLLELAPVDPRSLMQGDYMALRYKISRDIEEEDIQKRGYCIVALDSNSVATRIRFQEAITPLDDFEYPIEYTASSRWNINIGTESYFFQEGHGTKYEAAKFGGVKIDGQGNSVLIGLYDKEKRRIE